MARQYEPFYMGLAERGKSEKCTVCGAAKRNEHSLSEAGKCDWLRKPKAERDAILAKQAKEAA